jgi:hypothetical protein
MNQIR